MIWTPTETVTHHGGDASIKRDQYGRPLLKSPCPGCDGSGKVASAKTGKPVKCPKRCEGETFEKAFTRVTTFIDVLEDKSALAKWMQRQVLRGVALEPSLLEGVRQIDTESREGKTALDAVVAKATTAAGSEKASERGTDLHLLTEAFDAGQDLGDLEVDDIIALNEYEILSSNLEPVAIEELVVHDELGVAGTPDRIDEWVGPVILLPDGGTLEPGDRLITDLKTGSVEYGGLKMAMQLATYSRSKKYAPELSGGRGSVLDVRTDWGLIKHLPAKGGEPGLYWADLNLGWEAVLLAQQVRRMRNEGRKALIKFEQ